MNEVERHGEIMGALGNIDARMDATDQILHRHESAIESVTEDVDSLNVFRAKTKGIALAVTGGMAFIVALTSIVAWAKGLL